MVFSKYKYWFLLPILVIVVIASVYFIVFRVGQRSLHYYTIWMAPGRSLDIIFNFSTEDVDGHPKLIIDHDGGADDAMAIFMALLYEQYFNGPKVLALTTTHGNVKEDQSFINSQRILSVAARTEVPIYRGSNFSLVIEVLSDAFFGADGLGDIDYDEITSIEAQPQHAAVGIIELTRKYPGEITLVTLGTLSNVALALRLDPTLLSRLAHLYVAAGHVNSADINTPEYNAEHDVEAYFVVAQNANPEKVTILPYSQVATSTITREWRLNILGAVPTKIMQAQNQFERISIDFKDTWTILDPIAMGAVLDNSIVGDIVYSRNSIHLCGESRGININNFTLMENANVKIINSILDEKYKELLISIFSAELA